MRLWELFEDITPAEVKQAERELDSAVYQPVTKMDKGYPVIDLELPVNDSHFMQRLIQRADKANIDIDQIKNLLKSAKRDPKMGYSDDIDHLSTAERPHTELVLQDPNKLRIPVLVKPNPVCARTQPGSSVCLTRSGQRAPRNTMVAKTVMRKGVPD